jgi:hypothetical protein
MDPNRKQKIVELLCWGEERLVADVHEVAEEVKRLNQIALPDGLKRFDQHDWMGYAGAERFPDGTEPLIGQVTVKVDEQEAVEDEVRDGAVETMDYIISPFSDSRDSTQVKVLSGFMFSNSINYTTQHDTLEEALYVFNLLKQSTAPHSLSILKKVFGFKIS